MAQDISMHQLGRTKLFRWVVWLVWDWGLIIASLIVMSKTQNWFVWTLMVIVIGSRQHAIAILGHDGTHLLASENRSVNDFLTNLFCFLPFGVTLNSYRTVHLQHHNHLGTDKDPELDFKKEMAPRWDLPISRRALALRFVKDLAGLGFRDVSFVMKSLPIIRRRDYIYLGAFWFLALGLLILIGRLWVIPVWFIAIFLSNWAVFRLRIWTEHVGTNGTHRLKATWWQRWLFLPHNTWYHYEHHKWPWVPFYHLSKARLKIDKTDLVSFSELIRLLSSSSIVGPRKAQSR